MVTLLTLGCFRIQCWGKESIHGKTMGQKPCRVQALAMLLRCEEQSFWVTWYASIPGYALSQTWFKDTVQFDTVKSQYLSAPTPILVAFPFELRNLPALWKNLSFHQQTTPNHPSHETSPPRTRRPSRVFSSSSRAGAGSGPASARTSSAAWRCHFQRARPRSSSSVTGCWGYHDDHDGDRNTVCIWYHGLLGISWCEQKYKQMMFSSEKSNHQSLHFGHSFSAGDECHAEDLDVGPTVLHHWRLFRQVPWWGWLEKDEPWGPWTIYPLGNVYIKQWIDPPFLIRPLTNFRLGHGFNSKLLVQRV